MCDENKKVFIVYNKQRWDEVELLKGFVNEQEAENLCKSLEDKEDRYDEVYVVQEIDVKGFPKETLTDKQWKVFVKKLENVEYDKELAEFYFETKKRYKLNKNVRK